MNLSRFHMLLLVISVNYSISAQSNERSRIETQVAEYFKSLTKHDLFSGTILMVKGGNVLVNMSYGLASVAHNIENSPTTKFRIASLSKIFTKLAILQLSERGQINLDDPLSNYLPEFPKGDKISIQQLIDHSSGISHLNDFSNYDKLAKENYSIRQVIDLFKDKPLDFEPGSRSGYSNSGYVLLAFIIEQASGLSYAEFLDKNIFKPAGMRNSGHDDGVQIVQNLAQGYMMNLKGKGLQRPLFYDPSIKIGGGTLYSTTGDLYLFSKAFKEGKLSETTKPLYNQGIFGKSPGYTSSIWMLDDLFVVVLSNNYSGPIKRIARDLSSLMLHKKYKVVKIQEDDLVDPKDFADYEGNFKIGDDIETIQRFGGVLVEYENDDYMRGCRLIPLKRDVFFDTCYLEELTFIRDAGNGRVNSFVWESGDKATWVSNLPVR